jgi:fatty acid desaturase
MANDRDQPELPRVEPEIIPPDRAGRRPGWHTYGPNGAAGMHRVYVTRIGPFGFALLTLAFAILAAAILLVFAGAILLWLPVVALLIVVGAVVRFLR